MGPQKSDRAVYPGLARNFTHFYTRLAQWILRLGCRTGLIVQGHILGDPLRQESLTIPAGHESADFVAHDGLQVMRKSRNGENVRSWAESRALALAASLSY